MTRKHLIKFKKIRWKNLFSYGNTWTEVDLARSPSTLITGKNGGGKSVLFEALHILLTGTSIRPLKKAVWVNNRNNKGLVIEGEFSLGEDEYKLTRGVKPDVFTIEKNGVPMAQEASVRDMQLILYRDIMKSDKVGLQITSIISKSGIQMFMSLKAEERRRFIDNMLGCSVFTVMAKHHKSQFDALKSDIEATTLSLTRQQALEESKAREIEGVAQMLKEAAEARELNYTNDLAVLQRDLAAARKREQDVLDDDSIERTAEQDVKDAQRAVEEAAELTATPDPSAQKELEEAQHRMAMCHDGYIEVDADDYQAKLKKIKSLQTMRHDLAVKVSTHQQAMDSLKEGFCSSCKQNVGAEHIAEERRKIAPKLMQAENMVEEIQQKIEALEAETKQTREIMEANAANERERAQAEQAIARAQRLIDASKDRVVSAQRSAEQALKKAKERLADATVRRKDRDRAHREAVTLIEHKIVTLKRRYEEPAPEDTRVDALKAEHKVIKKKLAELSATRDAQAKKAEYFTLLTQMLKDGGVKTVIVKRYLPIVNRVVNEKLRELGFHAKFTMDENFEEEIVLNGNTYTFHQFSEGEKLRINLALIMAWREVARMQGRMDTNLLMFDEQLDGSLDDQGYEALTDIFKLLDDLNVFIISHNPSKMENFVRSKMAMAKVDGFSKIVDVIDA